jgi:hypothetical protein
MILGARRGLGEHPVSWCGEHPASCGVSPVNALRPSKERRVVEHGTPPLRRRPSTTAPAGGPPWGARRRAGRRSVVVLKCGRCGSNNDEEGAVKGERPVGSAGGSNLSPCAVYRVCLFFGTTSQSHRSDRSFLNANGRTNKQQAPRRRAFHACCDVRSATRDKEPRPQRRHLAFANARRCDDAAASDACGCRKATFFGPKACLRLRCDAARR